MGHQSDSLEELFEIIDVDESGEVDIDEFCDGVAKLVYCDAPIELVRILKQLNVLRRDVQELKDGSLTTLQWTRQWARQAPMETSRPTASFSPLPNGFAETAGIRHTACTTDLLPLRSPTTTSMQASEQCKMLT